MPAAILLKNGTALIHTVDDRLEALRRDILIEGNMITRVDTSISPPPETEVIDCTDKIISPGFVDTHHHVWQTQLKGRHADHTLLEYFPSGNFTSQLYTPTDTFWGQLGGCMEMIDCGTTTVVDFAHLNYLADHNYTAISATVSSGIRSTFCYCPMLRTTSWDPFTVDPNALGGHVMPTLDELAKASPFGDGRVTLGFAFDGFQHLPQQYLDMLMAKLASLKISLITFHYLFGPVMGNMSIPQAIDATGYLDERFLVAHSSNMPEEDVDLYRKRGVHLSTTPSTELQMSMGVPVPAFSDKYDNAQDLCSLGIDCHSCASAFIPGEARLALQSARAIRGQKVLDRGKQARTVGSTVEEAFNQATIRGARAVKMGNKIGSIAEGKLADVVIFDANSPSMICGGVHDPVAAIILHSSPADIDTVIVDGIVRKRGGKLVSTVLDEGGKAVAGKESLVWADVAKKLIQSREGLQREIDKIDMKAAEKGVMQAFHIDEADIVDA